jgi:competence protein CoiA
MLCANRKSTQKSVNADLTEKSQGPFMCPQCEEEVWLRKSQVRISHFAHRPSSLCSYSAPESEAHKRCKRAIYEALLKEPGVKNAALERSLKTCRPDISARINGVPVAIEVQISTLSLETIIGRTQEYTRRGIYVLWLLRWTPYLDGKRYSPRLWERWVHALYFGHVYYWIGGLRVVSYQFKPYYDVVEGIPWYCQKGKPTKKKRYKRKSKRYCMAVKGNILNLARNFIAVDRNSWTGGNLTVFAAKIFRGTEPCTEVDSGRTINRLTGA